MKFSRRFRRWSDAAWIVSGILFTLFLVFAFVLNSYPWPVSFSHLDQSKLGFFSVPWPRSLREEEKANKKNLKRLSKSEQNKKYDLQMQRMNVIYTPILDILSDASLSVVSTQELVAPEASQRYLPWPFLDSSADSNRKTPIYHYLFSKGTGVSLQPGVFLRSAQEMRFNLPFTTRNRYLKMAIVPLSSGAIKITAGQNSWGRIFFENDIHKPHWLNLLIQDGLANQVKILAASAYCIVLDAMIMQREKTGRLPIQLAKTTPFWRPSLTLSQQNNDVLDESDVLDDADLPTDSLSAGTTSSPANASTQSESKAAEKEPVLNHAAGNATSVPTELTDLVNPQIYTESSTSVALGYNLLFIQTDEIPRRFFKDRTSLSKIAPHFKSLLDESFVLDEKIILKGNEQNLFYETVFGKDFFRGYKSSADNLKYQLQRFKKENLYFVMRNFGYHVFSAAPADYVGLPDSVAKGWQDLNLEGKWLDPQDWEFLKKNKVLDSLILPASGLDAVFQSEQLDLTAPIYNGDMLKISHYLKTISAEQPRLSEWGANDMIAVPPSQLALVSKLDYFQNWLKNYLQTRFFAHFTLDHNNVAIKPTAVDLVRAVRFAPLSWIFAKKSSLEKIARLSLMDRSLDYLLESIRLRYLQHRTILVVMVPHEVLSDSEKSGFNGGERPVTFIMKLPGVLPLSQAEMEQKIGNNANLSFSVDDTVATVSSTLGIPWTELMLAQKRSEKSLEQRLIHAESFLLPNQDKVENYPKLQNIFNFNLLLRNGDKDCLPLFWKATSPLRNVQTSSPVTEIALDWKGLTIYPHSTSEKFTRVSWQQEIFRTDPVQLVDMGGELGGYFDVKPLILSDLKHFVSFYFGEKMLPLNSAVFSVPRLSLSAYSKIFDSDVMNLNSRHLEMLLEQVQDSYHSSKALSPSCQAKVWFWRSK